MHQVRESQPGRPSRQAQPGPDPYPNSSGSTPHFPVHTGDEADATAHVEIKEVAERPLQAQNRIMVSVHRIPPLQLPLMQQHDSLLVLRTQLNRNSLGPDEWLDSIQ